MRGRLRMETGEAGQRGHLVVEDRVVLHGARAERIELQRLAEIQLREAQKMAQDLRLAEFRKALDGIATQVVAENREGARCAGGGALLIDAATARRRFLEDQRYAAGGDSVGG